MTRRLLAKIAFALAVAGVLSAARKKERPPAPIKEKVEVDPLVSRPLDEVVRNFLFVGDFSQKDETRPNSKEIFWRYPTQIPKIKFPFSAYSNLSSPEVLADFPKTEGEGRAIQHLNAGRLLFIRGDIEGARQTWLGGRARYGNQYDYNRRTDYFISQAFFYKALKLLNDAGKKIDNDQVHENFIHATNFMMSAFDKKKDFPDPLLERVTPRTLYNLASIYFNYEKWGSVVGAATLGLDYLRKTGRKEFRPEFRRMNAEMLILSREYPDAFQELDLALRQDEDMETASHVFSRIGDVYFDLSNFELAEEVYSVSSRIDRSLNIVRPAQYILRGESLFWLGRFEESQKILQYGLDVNSVPSQEEKAVLDRQGKVITSLPTRIDELSLDMQALASLRMADNLLALGQLEKAKLAYFQHIDEFRQHMTTSYARLRLACLELPQYDGNNIQHARELLVALKGNSDIAEHKAAQEMAWTCEMASIAQHERTPAMVDRVRDFYKRYPTSPLLKDLVDPIREVQARNISPYFEAKDQAGAIEFFEKKRAVLYLKVPDDLANKMFVAYVDTEQSEKAKEFLPAYERQPLDGLGNLRLAVGLAEFLDASKNKERDLYTKKNEALSQVFQERKLEFKPEPGVWASIQRIMATDAAAIHYPWILRQGLRWTDSDLSWACNLVYPILDKYRTATKRPFSDEEIRNGFIDKHLPDLIRFETGCAYSLLDLETSYYKGKMSELAKRYLDRSYLIINQTTAPMFWGAAEGALEEGDRDLAVKIWMKLVASGSSGLAEVRYAKARLDNRKTELENLWKQK